MSAFFVLKGNDKMICTTQVTAVPAIELEIGMVVVNGGRIAAIEKHTQACPPSVSIQVSNSSNTRRFGWRHMSNLVYIQAPNSLDKDSTTFVYAGVAQLGFSKE